ncbi:MAG: Uncharacterized protein LiPW41_204 [Parcubacteria group bacterium LiPW_41]|nr:MAG: Uncharacterized protein LiPW41_204 [Parcubacteria group bacterium LiPW_41]
MVRVSVFFVCILFIGSFLGYITNAATNISSTAGEYFAWNDISGWWDLYSNNTVEVQGSKITGYASSTIGEISFDCGSTPSGNICNISQYGICNGIGSTKDASGACNGATATGDLVGYAWNDVLGWISISCHNTDGVTCTSDWGVTIDTNGDFKGYAWSDIGGWVSFNCGNVGSSCSPNSYKVNTSWRSTSTIALLDSAVIDTQSVGGATLNSITWKGTNNANSTGQQTYVDFQIAVSNSSSGPWNFIGPSGTSADYYSASCESSFKGGINAGGNAPNNTPICIDPAQVKNMRYIRYRVRMRSNLIQTDTPRIDDVILNWSK